MASAQAFWQASTSSVVTDLGPVAEMQANMVYLGRWGVDGGVRLGTKK